MAVKLYLGRIMCDTGKSILLYESDKILLKKINQYYSYRYYKNENSRFFEVKVIYDYHNIKIPNRNWFLEKVFPRKDLCEKYYYGLLPMCRSAVIEKIKGHRR